MPDPTGRVSHIDAMHRGMSWKTYCRVATTGTITIATALNAGDTIDGVTLAAGDRVLVKDQSTGSQNGIYIAGATPVRAWDMDQDATTAVPAEEVLGTIVQVIAGTANGGKLFRCTNTTAPVIGTTSLVFADFTPSSVSFATPAIVLGTAAAAGAASTVIRSDSTIVAFDTTDPTTIAYGDAPDDGAAAVAARRDHRHGMAAATGIGEILISDSHSTPLVFADLLQNEAGSDLLYDDP